MNRSRGVGIAALPLVAALACGGSKVMVPPRIDLQQHEVLAIIEFASPNEGKLGELATSRFMEEVRLDQGLVRIVELGTEEEALRQVGAERLDRAAYTALGAEHNVATIFVGELVAADFKVSWVSQ